MIIEAYENLVVKKTFGLINIIVIDVLANMTIAEQTLLYIKKTYTLYRAELLSL